MKEADKGERKETGEENISRRRTSPRIQVKDTRAIVRRKGFLFNRGKQEMVDVKDIGPRGLSFGYPEPVSPDTGYEVVIFVPEKGIIRCLAKVRNIRRGAGDGYVLGLEFKNLSDKEKKILRTRNILETAEVNVLDHEITLGEKLRTIRSAMGLTIIELSEISGVRHQDILDIEVGKTIHPSTEILNRLADGLEIERSDLVENKAKSSSGTG